MASTQARTEDGVATVRRFMEHMSAGRFEEGMDMLASDIVVHEPPSLHFGGDYIGPDGFRELCGHLATMSPSTESFDCFAAGDDLVVAQMVGTYTAADTGKSAATSIVELYKVRDGQIAEVDVYLKDPSAIAALATG